MTDEQQTMERMHAPHSVLRSRWPQGRAGSTPAFRTTNRGILSPVATAAIADRMADKSRCVA